MRCHAWWQAPILLVLAGAVVATGRAAVETSGEILAQAVVGCSYVAEYVSDIETLPKETRCAEILKVLDQAGAEAIRFSHLSYFVKATTIGNKYGFERKTGATLEESGIPYIGLLFVTDSVNPRGDRILIVFSQVAPERTIVITMDEDLRSNVVYDSHSKVHPAYNSFGQMGSVYQLRTLGRGRFLLEERRIPGEPVANRSNRAFQLVVKNGNVKILLAADR
jgi:hypothetical protein